MSRRHPPTCPQVVHYQPGQLYKSHWDAVDPHSLRGQYYWSRGYGRKHTMLVYLNDLECDMPGCKDSRTNGCTLFAVLGLAVKPSAGDVLYFENVDEAGELYEEALHSGMPVCHGEKWAVNCWVHLRDLANYPPWPPKDYSGNPDDLVKVCWRFPLCVPGLQASVLWCCRVTAKYEVAPLVHLQDYVVQPPDQYPVAAGLHSAAS